MYKKNLTIKETFELGVKNHQKNNLKIAENFYNQVLKKILITFNQFVF